MSECLSMAVLIPTRVVKEFRKLPKADAARLLDALDAVAASPATRQSFVTEMVGQPGVWRLGKGEWRVVYRIVEGDVVLDHVAHRREVYE